MENSEQKILSDIKEMISSMKQQLEQLESKIDLLQTQIIPSQQGYQDEMANDMEPIDIMISEDFQIVEAVSQEVNDDLPFDDVPSEDAEPSIEFAVEDVKEEPVEEPEPELLPMEEEPIEEPEPELLPTEEHVEEPVLISEVMPVETSVQEHNTLIEEPPVLFETPQTILQKAEASSKTSLADAMVSKQAWRTDVPGAPVKDVRGAIALMDRVIFINKLFHENPMAFQDTLTQINQMETFDQAVEYLSSIYPEWNLDSDVVYRFMMAVRRKLN